MSDTINLTRATVQQALEALEAGPEVDPIFAGETIDALKAAPEQRTDGMPASADERYLRRLLAVRVGIPGAYYDDGEAHGAQHGISIDFMREPVADIDAKLRALNVARAALEQTEQAVPYAVWRQGFDAVRKHKEDKHE